MPIVSSTYSVGHAQRNGARYVTFRHEWDTGEISQQEVGPLFVESVDLQAVAQQHAEEVARARFERGYEEVIAALRRGENPFPENNADFPFGTRLQVLGRIFQEYATAPAIEIYIFSPFIDAVHDNEFAAMGLTAEQIAATRAKVEELKQIHAAMFGYVPLSLE